MTQDSKCLIWGTPCEPPYTIFDCDLKVVPFSDRAGGGYQVTWEAEDIIPTLTDAEKARLTTWLVSERSHGVALPIITRRAIESTRKARPISVQDRALRLLRFLGDFSPSIGKQIVAESEFRGADRSVYGSGLHALDGRGLTNAPLAWTESVDAEEVDYLLSYLTQQSWITVDFVHGSRSEITVLAEGYAQVAEQISARVSSQAFVAMWFDPSMDSAYQDAIAPAIESAGFTPIRIDRKEHINRIDDEIIAEIRRSRFLVADFSQGEDGARGGVYFEAGFAYGLDIPVVYTCRSSDVGKLSFDTRQYNHILWESPEELREALKNRILAVIGEGPNTSSGTT